MPDRKYVGKAGQLVVMAEFLLRGYNVAMPEVDVGDDIFVVSNPTGYLWRIQVKTSTGTPTTYGWSSQFSVSVDQLGKPTKPDLIYVFALRKGAGAWEFLVIPRVELQSEYDIHQVGSKYDGKVRLYMAFRTTEVICSQRDFQPYRNRWDPWPIL